MNKDVVENVLYKDDSYLQDRLSIFNYSTNSEDIWDWAWDTYPITNSISLLEVGAGFGGFWQRNSHKLSHECLITLTDISSGMLQKCEKNLASLSNFNPKYCLADVEQLSFADNSFDIVFAHFVLYYAQSPKKALQEIKRVLKPGGIASIFTMHSESNKELYEIAHACDDQFPSKDILLTTFCQENAEEYLKTEFVMQNKYQYMAEIIIPSGACLLPVFRSMVKTYGRPFTNQLFEKFKVKVDEHIRNKGQLKTTVCSMLYICKK
jgi:ubiquinone/menaquinone biosynthesis C-methylase UbiE